MLGVLLIAVLIGLIPAAVARSKGQSFVLWWLYGAALFIVALPHALLLKTDQQTLDERAISSGGKKCPHCAEIIRQDAKVCRFCGRDVPVMPATSFGILAPQPPTPVATESDDELMATYGIVLDGDKYRFGEFRYDKLSDAVNYARLQQKRAS